MRFLRPGRLIIYLILGIILRNSIWGDIDLDKTITLKEGGSITSSITQELGWRDRLRLKWSRRNNDALRTIQPGQYVFSGEYSPDELTEVLLAGPTSSYNRITVLEGRNARDVDALLTDAGFITAGEYEAFVTNPTIISKYIERYDFLRQAQQERGSLTTLEGYLYPETYMVDPSKDIIDQLVYLQLEVFNERIWKSYGDQLASAGQILKSKGYSFPLSSYGALILASVIEKEESLDTNKPLIASIFFNRLDADMRLDADITLCYGFKEPYETCTPARIAQHLDDTANPYNTRANKGLPPTPISSVHISSLQALFDAPKTDYLFYLHNNQGKIFPAKTNAEHNLNKSKEL